MEIDLEKLLITGTSFSGEVVEEKLTPATLPQVLNFEKKIGTDLPTDYRNFLLWVNGGRVNPNLHSQGLSFNVERLIPDSVGYSGIVNLGYLFPLYDGPDKVQGIDMRYLNLDFHYEEYKSHESDELMPFVPPHCIPIAQAPGEAYMLLAIDGPYHNKVLYWAFNDAIDEPDQMYGSVSLAANSFSEFVAALKPT